MKKKLGIQTQVYWIHAIVSWEGELQGVPKNGYTLCL